MRRLLPLMAFLGLSACFDADVTLNFTDADTATATIETRITRAMFDMTGESAEEFCDGGTPELTTEHLICRETETLSIAALLDGTGGDLDAFSPEDGVRIDRVDDVTLKVTFDFPRMMEDQDDMPADMDGMQDMFAAMFAGHSLVFNVQGYRIVNTTGTLNDDETIATRVIPLAQFIAQGPEVQTPFVSVVQLEPNCVLGVFCD